MVVHELTKTAIYRQRSSFLFVARLYCYYGLKKKKNCIATILIIEICKK